MRGHHERDLAFDCHPEGKKLPRLEEGKGGIHNRKSHMRIEARIAMAGKMLSAGKDPGPKKPAGKGQGFHSGLFRIGREGTVSDDGILGVGVHIEDGGKVDIKAQAMKGLTQRKSGFLDLPLRLCSEDFHGRKGRDAIGETSHPSTFLIDSQKAR